MIEQNLADDDHGLYIEEHGIGMSLETWALAGIHDDTRVIGESRSIRIGLSRTVGLHGDTFVRLPNRIGTSYRGIEWQARYTQDLAKVALSSERELYKTHVEALADDKLYEELRNLHTRWPQPVEYQKSRRGGRSRVNDIHHAHA